MLWYQTLNNYNLEIEYSIDDKISKTMQTPIYFIERAHELFFKYDLDPGKHTLKMKIKNPNEDVRLDITNLITYKKKSIWIMLIIKSYEVAVILCFITMFCWGSWANTQKLASKSWAFPLYYWDYSIGVILLSLIFGLSFGSFGENGRSFLDDLYQGSS